MAYQCHQPSCLLCLSCNVLRTSLTPICHGFAEILCLWDTTSTMCELKRWTKIHSRHAYCVYLFFYTRTSVIVPLDFTYETQVKSYNDEDCGALNQAYDTLLSMGLRAGLTSMKLLSVGNRKRCVRFSRP